MVLSDSMRDLLIQRATAALQEHAITNRSALPPFRLPQVAQRIVAGLRSYSEQNDDEAARTLGGALARQGRSLRSLLAVGRSSIHSLATAPEQSPDALLVTNTCLSLLAEGLAAAEQQEVIDQRQAIQRSLERTIQEQQNQEGQLRMVIQELSTPILPIYAGMLVLPLVGSIDSRRSQDITEQLLMTIAERQAEMVIIDITGVPVIDTEVANHLLMTTRAVRLLGAQVLLVGISAEIAQTIVQLGVALEDIVTLSNLQSGIEYALRQQGLGIVPLSHNGYGSRSFLSETGLL